MVCINDIVVLHPLTTNFTDTTLPAQPLMQQDDMGPDEDEAAGVVHESLGLAHSDVKLAQTPGVLTIFSSRVFI